MNDADPYPIEPPATVAEPRRRSSQLSIVLVLAGIALAGFFAWKLASGVGKPKDGAAASGGAPGGGRRGQATVGVAKAGATDVPITPDALGTVVSPVTATVRTQIAGTLFSVGFREG